MSDFLAEMAAESGRRARMARADLDLVTRSATAARPPVPLEISAGGFDLIAEVKVASPSEGTLMTGAADAASLTGLAGRYRSAGAVAISVLTEETRFAGSLGDLEAVAAAVPAPVMRKDFLVDPVQVVEARASGASGVLLIARILSGDLLAEMVDLAHEWGMFALVEVFDRADLEAAERVFDRSVLLGVNCRDLATLEVDRSRFESLAPYLPGHLPAVAESGMSGPGDVAAVATLGYRMALVGSSLVRSPEPGRLVAEMLSAGRSRVAETAS